MSTLMDNNGPNEDTEQAADNITVQTILGQPDLWEKFLRLKQILAEDYETAPELASLVGSVTEAEVDVFLRKFFSTLAGKTFLYAVDEFGYAELKTLPESKIAYMRTALPNIPDEEIFRWQRIVEAFCPVGDLARVWEERQSSQVGGNDA
jgi:hypothetical protein